MISDAFWAEDDPDMRHETFYDLYRRVGEYRNLLNTLVKETK